LRVIRITGGIIVTHRRLRSAKAAPRTTKKGKVIQNEILVSMLESEFRLLRSQLEEVDLPSHRSLCEPDELFEFAYFPNAGLISIVVVLSNGKTVEAGLIGNEGIVGLPGIAGSKRSPLREVVQISGTGLRIKIGRLRKILESTRILDGTLKRYASVLAMQIAQTAACNRLHDVDRRLARWLSMAGDRVDSGTLRITHEYLATMLGTDRSSVSLAARDLQKTGIIEYSRGVVKLLDRPKLEAAACECYRVIRDFNGGQLWPRQ
jgi:CRP-like cAMP-binding protein